MAGGENRAAAARARGQNLACAVQIAYERPAQLGRKTRPDLEIGICGEHGGEPSSVEFCVKVGMNYVSCSPYRVPIARLAAAQARIAMAGGEGAEANRTK